LQEANLVSVRREEYLIVKVRNSFVTMAVLVNLKKIVPVILTVTVLFSTLLAIPLSSMPSFAQVP
jgi:hypothetical protein